jgi:hypothetical protein
MMIYHRFAEAYGWPPSVVDKLTRKQLFWLPVIKDAASEAVGQYRAAHEKN